METNMAKMKRPDYYALPLRKKADMAAWIVQMTQARHYGQPHPFCFNVKVYDVNFDFEHLLEVYRERILYDELHCEGDPQPDFTQDDSWLKEAREQYEDVQGNLWEWALEESRAQFVGRDNDDAFDTHRILYDGTEVQVQYSFEGRSGGWLSINSFEGTDFLRCDYYGENPIADMLMNHSQRWLRRFYELVVMLRHDVATNQIRKELEYQAAWVFFECCCADIPRPESVQKQLPFPADTE